MRRPEVLLTKRAGAHRLYCSDCGPLERVYPTRTDAAIARKAHSFAHTQGLGS